MHLASQPVAPILGASPLIAVPSVAQAHGASLRTPRPRSQSRATALVVHSRVSGVCFRILSTHGPVNAAIPVSLPTVTFLPVSLPQGHRMCQKAMDCYGDETSHWYQW